MATIPSFSTLLLAGGLFLTGCRVGGGLAPATGARSAVFDTGDGKPESIALGISLYLLVDDEDTPNPALSTARTEEELLEILDGMNAIRSQANIRLDLETLAVLEVPEAVLMDLMAGDLHSLFAEQGDGIILPGAGTINGFYVRSLGGPNGITAGGTRSFFVMDKPSVLDRRVSSHELGHILGLRRTSSDRRRLLYPGTNGMRLTREEAGVAGYVARKLIKPRNSARD